jgi:hypothetical protein
MTKKLQPALAQNVAASVGLVENLLRGKETGHRIELSLDKWVGVGPGGRIQVSPRDHKIISPDGRTLEQTWTVVKQGNGMTIKPILEYGKESFLVLIYKPQPSVGEWLLEFPSGGKQLVLYAKRDG